MWKRQNSRILFTHPRLTLVEDTVTLPTNQTVPYLLFANKHDGVVIICKQGNQILIQQEYSYPVNEVLFQFPGGKVDSGEDVAGAAKRELQEESGYAADIFTPLGWFYPDNRRTASKLHVYLAESITPIEKVGGDPEESIVSQWLSIDQIQQMITEGKIVNFALLSAWALFCSRNTQH